MKITKRAYGKINLTLEILGKREDGYHEMSTVMQSVSLYDTVSVSNEGEKGIHISCNLPFIPTDERNIVYKAVALFYNRLGKKDFSTTIHIDKHIPVGGGMAGGSTNCGSVLLALNEIENLPFSKDELLNLGGSLGADVPFTMIGGAALATGIGDILTPIKSMPNCYIVLCKPKFSISTKAAFEGITKNNYSDGNKALNIIAMLESKNLDGIAKGLYNSFETPAITLKPQINKIKCKLMECGALGALMTGSGSTVYGIFNSLKKAECAKNSICRCMAEAFIAKPIL